MKGFMVFLPQAARKSAAEAEPVCAPRFFLSLFPAKLLTDITELGLGVAPGSVE